MYNADVVNPMLTPLMGKPRLDAPFNWKLKFKNKEVLFPVLPDLERSWNAALVWGWSGSKEFRAFYELYLANNPAGVFWDIGANDGTHAYLFASQGFKCVCFEPQPSCIGYINKVIEANNFTNIEVLQTALGNQESGTIDFFISESSWYSSAKRESVERFEKANLIKVPITKIDHYWQSGRPAPNLIKIDVEGFEWEVIEGGLNFFRSVKPPFLIEIDMTTGNFERIYNFFAELDYKIYRMVKGESARFIAEKIGSDNINSLAKTGNVDFIILPVGVFRDKFEEKLLKPN